MFKQKSSFALNVSDHSIEILELHEEHGIYTAGSYGRALLESGIIDDGKIIAHDKLKLALKRLLQQAKPQPPTSREVIIALPESKVFVTAIDVPKTVADRNIPAALASRARELIPLDPAQTAADFLVSRTTPEYTRYVYAATYRELIAEYQTLLQSLRLKLTSVSLESVALAHAVIDPSADSTALLIDMGARTTIASIFANGVLQDSITIRIAGNHLTNALAEKLKLSPIEAEQRKITHGLATQSNDAGAEMLILQGQLQPLKDELLVFVKYYEEYSKDTIDRIVLAGGSSPLPGLAEYFESNIGLPTGLADPLPPFKSLLKPASLPKFLVVAGLAALLFQRKPFINLLARTDKDWLPRERLKVERTPDAEGAKPMFAVSRTVRQTGMLLGVMALAALIFAGVWFWKNNTSPEVGGQVPPLQLPTAETGGDGRSVNVLVQPITGAQTQSLSFSFAVLLLDETPPVGSVTGSQEEISITDFVTYSSATEEYVRAELEAAQGGEVAANPTIFAEALQRYLAHTLWESKAAELSAEYETQGMTLLPLYSDVSVLQSAEPATAAADGEKTMSLSASYTVVLLNGTTTLDDLAQPYIDAFAAANPGYVLEKTSYKVDEAGLPDYITVTALYSYVALSGPEVGE